MGDTEGSSEQDDVSFLRTDDMVCLQHGATGNRVCLAAEGFGNRHCYLENIADKNIPPEMPSAVFVIEQALSVRALQEMVTAEASGEGEEEGKGSGGGGHRTLLYGHAVLLRHGYSNMYLACLSTSSSKDKLSFDVGLREDSSGEACWWTIHPASKQRSEGEKVRVGDDLILVSVATERYLHTAQEGDESIVNASFHQTHWSIAPFGTGASRAKNVGFVFGGEVLRFFHGGDECLTVPTTWADTPEQNTVIYEGGAVFNQARSLWRLDLTRTKWSGGFINWSHPMRFHHITTGRFLGINDANEIVLLSPEEATISKSAFCLKVNKEKNKDDKRESDEKEEEVIGLPLIKFGDTTVFVQHVETGLWLSYKTNETQKRGVGKVEEKQAIMSEEGKMDDGLEFSRSQEEEAKTARVIRKCGTQFNRFIVKLNSVQSTRSLTRGGLRASRSPSPVPGGAPPSPGPQSNAPMFNAPLFNDADQEAMIMCLEDLINYFAQPDEGCNHEEKMNKLKALRNRQDLFQEEGILNLILETVDKMNIISTQGLLTALLGEESSSNWDLITNYLYQLLAAIIKGNHTNCAHFAQSHRLDWLFSSLSSQQASEGTGMLDVLHCVLIDSPEALNMMKETHIKSIISLLEKHGRDPKVLDVLCSLCVGNGVAVRSSQNNICDNLLPSKNLLLQTRLVDQVASMRPNVYVGKVDNSAMYRKWYFEVVIDHIETVTNFEPHFRVGWANTCGYVPYPSGGSKWGGNGVGDDLYSYGFDGSHIYTCGRANHVRNLHEGMPPFLKNDVIGCILDLSIPLITFTVNGIPIRGCFKNFSTDGMFYPVISFSAKFSCRFLFGGDHGRLKFGPPQGHSPIVQTLLPLQELNIEPCFQFGDLSKGFIFGPNVENIDDAAFVPKPVDTGEITLPTYIESVRDKLAENTHEVWSMNKIEAGWIYSETRDDMNKTHPCLTSFERLPLNEKKYDTTLALQTLKTVMALGYRITVEKTPSRIKSIRLPNDPYLQSNGYKPAPMDLFQIELNPKMDLLVEQLAENTHNVWACERISQGWTYGRLEDHLMRRSPHLAPYKLVDTVIKKANRDTAGETVKTLIAYGYNLEPPSGDTAAESAAIFGTTGKVNYDFRSYRAEKTYAVTSGKWYYEAEILTDGQIKLGWANLSFLPNYELGGDENSYGYDCLHSRKSNANASETFGKGVQVGDVVACMLDLNDRTISYSLNGELLLDSVGSEAAFADIVAHEVGYVPALTLSVGQKVRLICGQDINNLKYFSQCGLQEGYQPFCVNMNRNMTFWFNKDEPVFSDVDENSNIEVVRIPAGSDSSPALKLSHKLFETQEKASWEFVRLSLPVAINEYLIDELEKNSRWEEIKHTIARNRRDKAGYHHSVMLEQHMLQSGFSLSDVKELNRAYSDGEGDENAEMIAAQKAAAAENRRGSIWLGKRKQSTLVKTKSFENELTVPSLPQAQVMMAMKTPKTRSTSVEALNRAAQGVPGEQIDQHKIRSKSPFRFFMGKKNEQVPGGKPGKPARTGRTAEIGTEGFLQPSINVTNASFRGLQPPYPQSNIGRRRSTMAPGVNMLARRGSRAKVETDLLPDESNDLLDNTVLDLVDEYFYGLRIFPGQDPQHVYVGWVTPNFKHFEKTFDTAKIRKVTLQVWSDSGQLSDYFDRQNCYMLNAGKLYAEAHEDEATQSSRSNQGMFIGCHVDTATGSVTFTADGKAIKQKFRIEPGIKLFPAIIFEATSKECLQFELGRTPTTLPLSSAILKTSEKHLTPQCPPRLKAQCLQPYQWSRVPNQSIRPHSLKLSDIRGWSMLCEDPISQLVVHIPEEDRCIDILELIELDKLLHFHAHSLGLYGALCFQGNNRAAHIICEHVDEKQLLYAIQSEYMSGPLRSGFADLLIDLHLEMHANARALTQNEFILPVDDDLRRLYHDEQMIHSISSLQCKSIRPIMKMNERGDKDYSIKRMSSPFFPVDGLKQFVMEALDDAVKKGNRPNRDPIGGSNERLFVPLIKLADKLLLIGGCIDDQDLERILILIDPETFDRDFDFTADPKMKGLLQMSLDEGVMLQMSHLLHHLMDLQLRHRVEAIIAFCTNFVGDLQADQLRRYIEIKQEDLPAAVAAKKTREFRCNPQEQMKSILGFKDVDEENADSCPTGEELKETLNVFHENFMKRVIIINKEDSGSDSDSGIGDMNASSNKSWSSKLFTIVKNVKSFGKQVEEFEPTRRDPPEDIFITKIVSTIVSWAQESEIENQELIRQIFHLLLRCYDAVGKLMEALSNAYVISDKSKADVECILQELNVVRALLPVQMGPEEEEVMRQALWTMVNNRVFFQHPDLIRILRVHENVMDVMMNTLDKQKAGEGASKGNDNLSEMVVACCRFLCFFCRSGKKNQKAMFDHLNFLLEHSNILLSRPSLRGTTPLDVAYSSLMENPELALALRENYLEKIAIYLSRCGLQANQEMIDKGYPDIGWDPVEGERYLDFLRFCVWVNGESVEENANLVIRLLIRRPECLGPALRGEGPGLLAAIKEAIIMSDRISSERQQRIAQGQENEDDEDYIDMGAAILNFYCTLVDVLGRCAPEPSTIAQGKNDCLRARAILRSLVPMDDLEGVLALRFTLTATSDGKSDMPNSLLPSHKQSIVLFLERVYGIDSQDIFFRILEEGFLQDIRAATMFDTGDNSSSDSEMSLALNRYLGNFVLPLLIKYHHYFANADNWSNLLDATLHTVYRLSKVKILTKGQRENVSDFLVSLTKEMPPFMLLRLLRKLCVDVSTISEYTTVAFRLLTLHYERCAKYYGTGGQSTYGTASEEERRLTMMLFSNIFDSLAKREYDPDLFGQALPCLTAIASALPSDYSMTSDLKDDMNLVPDDGPYVPQPVDTSVVNVSTELLNLVQKFSEHYHDAWASRKFEHGWAFGDKWDYRKSHPRLKPYHLLVEREKEMYKEPIRDAIKALLALGYSVELSDSSTGTLARQTARHESPAHHAVSIQDYNPQPVDMANLTLNREMQAMAERLAENAHDIWAKGFREQAAAMGGVIHPQMVPYDLLTDREKKKNRERSQELLKFLQYEGFKVTKSARNRNNSVAVDNPTGLNPQTNERRFASSLLEKLLQYMDTASISLKLLKPSANHSRRLSFKQTSHDVKFFTKVVLPLTEKYFYAQRHFFLMAITTGSGQTAASAGVATVREKELVASLFCKLAYFIRSKLSVIGFDAKMVVRCLQVLIQATDARTIVKYSPDFVKTSMQTFFNHAADDLANCVFNLQNARFPHIRGTTMKTSSSLNYIQLVLLPVLTSLFDHLAVNDFGADLLLNDIQVACYKLLNSLYILGTRHSQLTLGRQFIKAELDRHRAAIGNCLGAFASTFPVAFLEPHLNKHNKLCIHGNDEEHSLEASAALSELGASMPTLDELMGQIDKFVASSKYSSEPHIIDVIIPMICSYLPFWWSQGPDNVNITGDNYITMVTTEHLNSMLKTIFNLIRNHMGVKNCPWMVSIAGHAGQIIINSSETLLVDPVFPLAERLASRVEAAMNNEEQMRGFLKSSSEDTASAEAELQDEFNLLVRDVYAFYPLLIKYVDIQRAHWLKCNIIEAEKLYHCVAMIFNIWSTSQFFRREEQNFISLNEIDNMALIMPSSGRGGRISATKGDGSDAQSSKKVKKKRDGKRDKDKELAASLIVACLKRLLPVGLNLFAGREQELVQHAKEKFLKKKLDTDIAEYVKTQLTLPDKIDPSDDMSWQHYLYSKLGSKKDAISAVSAAGNELVPVEKVHPKDPLMAADLLVERIIDMAKVLFGLHMIDHSSSKEKGVYRSCVSSQRKRAVIACFRMTSLHSLPRHRAMNIFLVTYSDIWLSVENVGHEQLIENNTESFEEAEKLAGASEEDAAVKPDPIGQLVKGFSRAATTEHGGAMKEDTLYMDYAFIFSQSCGGSEEDEDEEEGEDDGSSIHEQEMEKQKLLFQQKRLETRGVAEMILLYISACKGVASPMCLKTLKLGISILKGGNVDIQMRMLKHLKEKKDVGFFISIAGLMNTCSVLDLDAFERNQKAEGLGVGSEGTAGEKNMHDAEFTCALFRFFQLLCEGHNLEFQNYLRTQAGNTTTVNVVIATVDYLLRLQESIMDFYWHYSSKEVIDPSGIENFIKAINVAKQIFSTLTESIQGPCPMNQQALAHSRLWDAVGGFMFLFAHMQEKLSKNSSQLDLLIELLDLQKEMVIMMLSMLEGNVLNGTIGKQMVDTLVESASNVEMILKFFDMFLKLKDFTSSAAFQEMDKKSTGWVTAKDFKKAMEQQKIYTDEEIAFLMSCCEPNHDGYIDYREFTERFHNPAKDIGFNLAVLLTNLSEHMTNDPRLQRFLETASSVLTYFENFLGRIEIMGSSGRIERVYFEISEETINQWEKPQICESKRAFFYSIVTEGGDKEKLESFINFCEDAIFEMKHASNISMEENDEPKEADEYPYPGNEEKTTSVFDPLKTIFGFLLAKIYGFFGYFKPSYLKKQWNNLIQKTWFEIIFGFFKGIFKGIYLSVWSVYYVNRLLCRVLLKLMLGEYGYIEEEEEEGTERIPTFPYMDVPPRIAIMSAEDAETTRQESLNADEGIVEDMKEEGPTDQQQENGSVKMPEEGHTTVTEATAPNLSENTYSPLPTPERKLSITPAEESKGESAGAIRGLPDFSNVPARFSYFLARNLYLIKQIALVLAFMINIFLLFYRVTSYMPGSGEITDDGSGEVTSAEEAGSGGGGSGGSGSGEDDDDDLIEMLQVGDDVPYLEPLLRLCALIHSFLSFCMLIAYYNLKVPLIIFKREKELARKIEFDGLYITQQPEDNQEIYWDKMVISTKSFPVNYWDKFVKKRVRAKYAEQYDYDTLSKLLGMSKSESMEHEETGGGLFASISRLDWKYQVWKVGVTFMDNVFLYNLGYFILSVLGNFSYFFFAAHLLDIAVVIPSLKTILQSVTHNGKQLCLTVMLLIIVVYIYTVIAFNFFRKFYVQEEDDEEPDQKCHNMLTCFVFHLYKGVRAGGGIGDEIESPDGDEYEFYRIIFDITFFFFVIVILLAIIQGLIIDAFGELRDQLQSVSDNMESSCFICGIPTDYFDSVPHGFEVHVEKEHKLANYMFFLMHLINKPDTDYTGQETYVWELYQKRSWDFFPIGECFRKQEEELSSGGASKD